jgi:hypothetical protein
MPDDQAGEKIAAQPIQNVTKPQPVNAQPPPDSPHAQNAKAISEQSMTTEIHGLEDRVRGAEKWMIWLTGGIVFLTAGIVIVGILQWNAMRGQLSEMHSGGVDTHVLAVQAKNQADAAGNLAEAAKAQTDKMTKSLEKTDSLIRQAAAQAKATNTLAEQARRSANIGAQSLESQTRPWITIDGDFQEITSDASASDVTVRFTLKLRNYGQSPALLINHQQFKLVTTGIPRPSLLDQYKVCDEADGALARGTTQRGFMDIVFPGPDSMVPQSIGIIAPEQPPANAMISCIAYRGPNGGPYHTRLIYSVQTSGARASDGTRSWMIRAFERVYIDTR